MTSKFYLLPKSRKRVCTAAFTQACILFSEEIDTSIENLKTLYPVQGNRSIQPSEIHTKVSNSSSSTTSTTENNIYDKTTENVHTDNNNLGSSKSGKYENMI
jgi:site-specific DNA-cytosine methylase